MSETVMLRGGPIAAEIRKEIAAGASRLKEQGITPHLAVIVASDDAAVAKYAEAKGRTAEKLGLSLELIRFAPGDGQAALEAKVSDLSSNPRIHGILLELPMDPSLDSEAAITCVHPHKDVDGLTAVNLGHIAVGRESQAIVPATPAACIALAESQGPLRGKTATLIGRGRAVGRALAPMLINRDVTVTVCHTKTPDLAAAIAPADVVFVAAGRAGLITGAHLREGQIVVDAGINVVGDSLVGDVETETALGKAAAITPVPGGVGPLTSTLIFRNLLRAIALQKMAGDL